MATIRGRNIITTQPNSYLFAASDLATGSYAANSIDLTHFSSNAGTKTVSGGVSLIQPSNNNNWVLETTAQRRDQSVTTYTGKGTVFLRIQSDGTAIFFYHNTQTTNGTLQVGVVRTGIDLGPTPDQFTGVTLWRSDDLVHLIPGYTLDDYDIGNRFTFSVKGFEINVQYNGVDVEGFRLTGYEIPLTWGTTGVKVNSNYSISVFNVTHHSNIPLYSNIAAKIVDIRDFGGKEGTTTGSATAGSYTLTVASIAGLGVTDTILIPPGYEAAYNGRAAGTRGTDGPGGRFPALSYTNATTMNADTSRVDGLHASLDDTGVTYKSIAGSWFPAQTYRVLDHWYINNRIPIGYHGKITAINGLTITVDTPFYTTFTNAPVTFDNSFIYNKLGSKPSDNRFPYKYPVPTDQTRTLSSITPTGWTIYTPPGNYAIGERISIIERDTLNFKGAGKTLTRIYSPDGCPSANLHRDSSTSGLHQDYTLEGNVKDKGFGLLWWKWDSTISFPQVYSFSSGYYPPGHMLFIGSHNCEFNNVKVKNVWAAGIATSYSNDVYVHDCEGEMAEGLHQYTGWFFQSADSSRNIFRRCYFTSPKGVPAFEQFGGDGAIFDDCHSINGFASNNSGSDFTYINCTFETTNDSFSPDWHSNLAPILNVNQNAAGGGVGGLIQNVTITSAETNANHDVQIGIIINPACDSITVKDTFINTANYVDPSGAGGGRGIKCEGNRCIIDGLVVTGTSQTGGFYQTNIAVTVDATEWPTGRTSTVKNCVAGEYYLSNDVTVGTGSEANTGTVIII